MTQLLHNLFPMEIKHLQPKANELGRKLNTAPGRILFLELPVQLLCGGKSACLLDLSFPTGWLQTLLELGACTGHVEVLSIVIKTIGWIVSLTKIIGFISNWQWGQAH